MDTFQHDVIDRLARLEEKVDNLQSHKDTQTTLKNYTVSGIISVIVAFLFGLVKMHSGN